MSEDIIRIKKSNVADTRTCDWTKVSKEELVDASLSHIGDVEKGMQFFQSLINDASATHDYTKLDEMDMFFSDFKTGFEKTKWFEMHQEVERHHLKEEKYIQEDVNLVDVIEMVVDGVMAGMARSGEYKMEEIPDSLLRKAFDNTIELLLNNVEVEGEE